MALWIRARSRLVASRRQESNMQSTFRALAIAALALTFETRTSKTLLERALSGSADE